LATSARSLVASCGLTIRWSRPEIQPSLPRVGFMIGVEGRLLSSKPLGRLVGLSFHCKILGLANEGSDIS